jgi:ring-1,2-phenylacetyl-CoA epoxidase subunit PaaD
VIAELLEQVRDPEIPDLSIADLGILRRVEVTGTDVEVVITPTYSGCPAMDQIRSEISRVLAQNGYRVSIETSYFPPWTTDQISPEGRAKLAQAGIAPPGPRPEAHCPRCQASGAATVSEFGSTACKALLVCAGCGEPFHQFKELR